MEICENDIFEYFCKYNDKFFGGILPIPNCVVRHSYRTLGYYHCDRDGYGGYTHTIEISDNYDYYKGQFRDILMHEMIHYYLFYTGADKRCRHGKKFKQMAKDFNQRYGMDINRRADLMFYRIKKGKSKLMFKICTSF